MFIGSKNISNQQLESVSEIFRIPWSQYKTQAWTLWTSCKCYKLPKGNMYSMLEQKLYIYLAPKIKYLSLNIAIQNITKDSSFDSELLHCRLVCISSKCNFTCHSSDHHIFNMFQPQGAKIQFLTSVWLHVNTFLITTNFCTYILHMWTASKCVVACTDKKC
jgi:hypothetical protein